MLFGSKLRADLNACFEPSLPLALSTPSLGVAPSAAAGTSLKRTERAVLDSFGLSSTGAGGLSLEVLASWVMSSELVSSGALMGLSVAGSAVVRGFGGREGGDRATSNFGAAGGPSGVLMTTVVLSSAVSRRKSGCGRGCFLRGRRGGFCGGSYIHVLSCNWSSAGTEYVSGVYGALVGKL